jgi:TolB protein
MAMPRRPSRPVAALVGAAVVLAAACGGPAPSPSEASTTTTAPIASGRPTPLFSAVIESAAPSTQPASAGPIASSGSIAVLGGNGSLAVVGADGQAALLASADDGAFGFPAWSPDGSRIAAIRSTGTEASIVVFDADADAGGAGAEQPAEPVVIFDSTSIGPFYLFWTPDGETVSFLANEAGGLSLRIAPADGSAPLDGSGPGALVRSGSPLYYDWIEGDRLLAHIGLGPEAFLGEMGLDGEAAAPGLGAPGEFRSAVVSHDQGSIAFVRASDDDPAEIVVAERDGSNEQATAVFGAAAVVFDPTGDTIASIGPAGPVQTPPAFPLGPLRLMDAGTGAVRTLLDGLVVSFWWSPDGKTIAALRIQPATTTAATASPLPSPAPPASEVRLVFVDVASGAIRSDPVVHPGSRFVEAFLAYFDQYALSHHVWAPDSSSMLLPEIDQDGTTRVTVRFPDGEQPLAFEGEIGFWSP